MTGGPQEVASAEGRLGVLLHGMGTVATTKIAGVHLARKGLAQPIGSLTQLNTIRLGQRSDNRTPLIKDFIGLASLDDIVFGGWDPIPDNVYESALNAGVLSAKHLDPIKDELSAIKPMTAAFDTEYVTRLDGPNKKTGANKRMRPWALSRRPWRRMTLRSLRACFTHTRPFRRASRTRTQPQPARRLPGLRGLLH